MPRNNNFWFWLIIVLGAYILIPGVHDSVNSFFGPATTTGNEQPEKVKVTPEPMNQELFFNLVFILTIGFLIFIGWKFLLLYKKKKQPKQSLKTQSNQGGLNK